MDDMGQTVEARAAGLLADLQRLRSAIDQDAALRLEGWRPRLEAAPDEVRQAATNLAAYLALRHADLRDLQQALTGLGLSSLGRCEGHVAASLDAVAAALARIAESEERPDHPAEAAFTQAAARIAARRDALFGPGAGEPDTRILATLATEAAEDGAMVRALVEAGADSLRINCAHDGPGVWAAMIGHVQAASAAAGRPVPVVMDIAGPKVRTREAHLKKGRKLMRGDRLKLLRAVPEEEKWAWATLNWPELLDRLAPGMPVWFDDGKLRAEVVACTEAGAELEVTGTGRKGAKLKPEKGVAVPGLDLPIPALGEADMASLDFVAGHADVVGFSFVQTVADVEALIGALAVRCGDGPRPAILLKVETAQAVRNLPELIVAAAASGPVAVMIARGDLAVDVGFERLSELQDEILWICEAAHVPVVWATQVLDGLLHDGLATRAETTDAAMGQRAECVMLNKGPHQVAAVTFLRSVLTRMERHQAKKSARLGPLRSW